ncbi:unnamed protein product [Protopolystoma xenopodis]|uniref:Uncharacterized protein n=1 Tax=Protopolystoma xenopodis TaxID=117903 RepID=A0A3S5A4U9_9PLAT|nr:unnamed protein product [Protopolystoma xenopodis]
MPNRPGEGYKYSLSDTSKPSTRSTSIFVKLSGQPNAHRLGKDSFYVLMDIGENQADCDVPLARQKGGKTVSGVGPNTFGGNKGPGIRLTQDSPTIGLSGSGIYHCQALISTLTSSPVMTTVQGPESYSTLRLVK